MISVIVPIKDEPPGVVERFARFARSPQECELVVVDGGDGGQTGDAFRGAGARVISLPGTRGARLAHASASARGNVLFFLHADSRPPDDALALISRSLARGADAGAFSLAYEGADRRMRWIAWWANRRSRLGLPFGDQGIFCRRSTYEQAGGFRDLPICDDVDLVRRLRKSGAFVVRPEKTVTSPRRYREVGALRQVLRTWRVLAGYYAGVSPETLTRWYEGR
ncbi:MAG TPA: TIGR04283 family arsenosugar biosynthesis glycosyltransferase [Thermoanaerobaculia bacterium]|nr:TIGR04283 family arsenosugar biosynthesis glycosyltransferase [Thermoanaerobaculia bacterium]